MRDREDNDSREGGGGFTLRDATDALQRRALLIVVLVLVAGGIAAGIGAMLPNHYEAIATVQIDPRKKTIVSMDAVLPDIAGDTPTIESQVEILKSRVIALRVIDVLGLRNDPEFAMPSLFERILRRLPFARTQAPRTLADTENDRRRMEAAEKARSPMGPSAGSVGADHPERDDIAAAFSQRLKTLRVRNTLVVEVRFTSRDAAKAARIANTIAEVYIRDQIDMKVKATGLASELLEQKLNGLRAKVAEAEHRIVRFKSDNGIFDAEGQLLSEKQLSRLMEQTIVARNTTAEARARFDQLQHMLRSGEGKNVADVLQSHTVRMLKDQLVRSTRREAELLTKYGPKHPELQKVRAEVADVEGQITYEIDQIIANLKNEYKVAEERERALGANLSQLKEQQSVSKEVSVKLRDLEREAETSRKVFETFLTRYKQTAESQELHLPDARIVERADIPSFPSSPKRTQILVIGIFAGLALGLGFTLLLELMTPGLVRPDDAGTTLGVPHLASVPLFRRPSESLADPMLSLRVVLAEPRGQFSRRLQQLQSELDQRRPDPAPRIILIVSSLPNEGKTVIAANLALESAARGSRTLLIDADLRRSKLSQQLGIDQQPGLLDAIAHGQDFEHVILQDTVSGLAVIPAGGGGRISLSPVEALEAPGFSQRLARLKAHFDTIIIDAPPLLPVVDARILADYADQIVFVATWRRTPKELVRRAVRLIGANSAKIMGLVINQVAPTEPAREIATGLPGARRHARPMRHAA